MVLNAGSQFGAVVAYLALDILSGDATFSHLDIVAEVAVFILGGILVDLKNAVSGDDLCVGDDGHQADDDEVD